MPRPYSARMTDDRLSGLALIAGSVGGIITMGLHPTGHDLFTPGQLEAVAFRAVAVHALALASMPVLFLGAWGLSRRLAAADRLAVAALVAYGVAIMAAMNAAVVSGLVGPSLARQILAGAPAASDGWRLVSHYNFLLNQAFAGLFTAASSAAILLWSAAIVRSGALARGVGIYGCVLGPVTLLALLSGHLRLDVHGFGLVVLCQTVWFVIVAAQLLRPRKETAVAAGVGHPAP
jgi:hypothetical protein